MDFHVNVKRLDSNQGEEKEPPVEVEVQCYRKGGRDRGEKPLYTLTVSQEEAPYAQLLALLYAQKHYQITNVQWRGEVLETTNLNHMMTTSDEELAIATSLIAGESCVPCTIKPRIISPHGRPITQESPKWLLDCVKNASEKMNLDAYDWVDPERVPRKSWISTSNTSGLLTTLNQMVRERLDVALSPEDISKAIYYYIADCGWKGESVKLAPLDFSVIDKINVPWKNSAGLVLSYTHKMHHNGYSIIYSPTGSKAAMKDAEVLRLSAIVCELKAWLDKEGMNPEAMIAPEFFPVLLTKIAEKPEVRQEGDDPLKVRVIFMVCLLELFLDKLVHSQFMYFTKTVGSNSIGTNWGRGDAYFYAKKHHAVESDVDPNEFFHFYGDASKLDQSIKARMLVMMSLLSAVCWDPNSSEYAAYMNLLAWSANITSMKYCYWPDLAVRLIKGIVFSGKYNTSHLDTMSLDLLFRDWMACAYEEIKLENPKLAKKFWSDYSKKYIVFSIYGDDFFFTCLKKYRKWINLKALIIFAIKRWDITIKEKASFETDHFFSVVERDVLKVEGVVFLKRRFIWVERPNINPFIGLWRPTEDYFVRVAVTGSIIDDPAMALARIYQLMRDSMGTNDTAWNFLEAVADELCAKFPYAPDTLNNLQEGDPRLDKLRDMTKKLGVTDFDNVWTIVRRPTQDEILCLFRPMKTFQIIKAERETKFAIPHEELLA